MMHATIGEIDRQVLNRGGRQEERGTIHVGSQYSITSPHPRLSESHLNALHLTAANISFAISCMQLPFTDGRNVSQKTIRHPLPCCSSKFSLDQRDSFVNSSSQNCAHRRPTMLEAVDHGNESRFAIALLVARHNTPFAIPCMQCQSGAYRQKLGSVQLSGLQFT